MLPTKISYVLFRHGFVPNILQGIRSQNVLLFKVIHPKYYKHLKKGAHQSHLDRQKMGWFLTLKY